MPEQDTPYPRWQETAATVSFLGCAILLIFINRHSWSIWLSFISELTRGVSLPALGGFLRAMSGHAGVLSCAVGLTLAWLVGGLVVAKVLPETNGSWEGRRWVAIGLGWWVLSASALGAALVGLFYGWVLVALAALLAVLGLASEMRGLRAFRLGRSAPPLDSRHLGMLAVVALPFLLSIPGLFVPPVYADFYQYHMAAPEHFLWMHRLALEGVNHGLHLQLSAELLNAFGVVIGREQLAGFIGVVPYIAALAYAATWVWDMAGGTAAILAVGLGLSMRSVFWVIGAGGNDLSEAAFCLFALVLQARGLRPQAALFWGIACATKINGLPYAALAWVWYEGARFRRVFFRWRPDWRWIVLVCLPVGPWFLKEWIAKGDPQWPLFSLWFGSGMWEARSNVAMAMMTGQRQEAGVVAGKTWISLFGNMPVIVLALPLLALQAKALPRPLASVLMMTVAAYVCFAFGYPYMLEYDCNRLALPLFTAWCMGVAVACERTWSGRPRWYRLVCQGIICATAWLPISDALVRCYGADSVRFITGQITADELRHRSFTTGWEARDGARRLPGVRTLLLVNDHFAYQWPGKVATEEFFDRLPTWGMTREADCLPRLLIRFRQRNITHIASNIVAEMAVSYRGAPYIAYPWTVRQLMLLRDFMKQHTDIALAPEHCDSINGAYYIYRVSQHAVSDHGMVYYLPGIKEVAWRVLGPTAVRNYAEATRRAAEMEELFPDVGAFKLLAGLVAMYAKDWKTVYKKYSLLLRDGMIWEFGHGLTAQAAVTIGKPEEALAAVATGRAIFNKNGTTLDILESDAHTALARQFLNRHHPGEAIEHANRAVALNPDSMPAQFALVAANLSLGRVREAQDRVQWVARHWPNNPQVQAACSGFMAKIGNAPVSSPR